MPAHHLTHVPPIGTAVLEVLAGADTSDTATRHRIDVAVLAEAIDAFTTAGLAAIHHPHAAAWYQAGITFADRPPGDTSAAIAAAFEQLRLAGAHAGWWFLRKPPGWRVRALDADHDAVRRVLDELATRDVIADWTVGLYEPETAAFGGTRAMAVVHRLFCADTQGVLRHSQEAQLQLGIREVSLLLIGAMAQGARLDPFETGDVFAKVATLRPPPPAGDADRLEQLATQASRVLSIPSASTDAVITANATLAHVRPWVDSFTTAGAELANLACDDLLGRGLRSVLSQIVVFHWNRLGLSAHTQAALANAALHGLLPGD